jgi:transposase-like protein
LAARGRHEVIGGWFRDLLVRFAFRPDLRRGQLVGRRGLRTDRSLLVILDGSTALHKAVRAIFEAALVQRCQVHKTRNILEYLSDRDRPWAQAMRRADQATEMKTA